MVLKILFGIALLVFAVFCGAALLTRWKVREIEGRFPATGTFVEVAGARIHYREVAPSGSESGVIVLLHGASGNESDMRLPLAGLLSAKGYRVISIDRPGHGWSTRDDTPSDPALQARQVRAALEAMGLRRVVVVGHSLAGAMTLQLALDHADFVSGVVLLAPVTHPWPGGIATYYKVTVAPVIGPLFAHTLVVPFAMATMDTALKSVFAPQSPPAGYREKTAVELVLRPATFRANAQDVALMYDFVAREQARYGAICIPVDIVTGDSDGIVLTHIHSYGSARAIPGSTLHVMPGVGHSPHWARSQEVAERITALAVRAR